jgi:predicted metal-dependent enzyme (double-stranded beta helix superfamily)
VSTRHYFQAGHAPSGFRPRVARGFEHPYGGLGGESERLDRGPGLLAEGRPGLLALWKIWDRLPGPIPEDWIRDGLRSLRINRDALRGCVEFHDRAWQGIRIHASEHYEAVVQCWRPGQAGPIQELGASIGGVLVVEGAATEIAYMATPCGRLAPSRSQRAHAGAVIVSRPRDVHQIANLEAPGTDLITLHVSSPPATNARAYRLAETIFADNDALADDASDARTAPI